MTRVKPASFLSRGLDMILQYLYDLNMRHARTLIDDNGDWYSPFERQIAEHNTHWVRKNAKRMLNTLVLKEFKGMQIFRSRINWTSHSWLIIIIIIIIIILIIIIITSILNIIILIIIIIKCEYYLRWSCRRCTPCISPARHNADSSQSLAKRLTPAHRLSAARRPLARGCREKTLIAEPAWQI